MPGQKIVDRAVAGWVSDGLLVGSLEIVDVQHLTGSGRLAKPRQQGLFLGQSHVLALASANRLRFERFDPAPVISHVRAVHRAQRNAHRRRNRQLRHVALTQQYHLDALALRRGDFPAQRSFQFADLLLGAFDHLSPQESDDHSESYRAARSTAAGYRNSAIQSAMESVLVDHYE